MHFLLFWLIFQVNDPETKAVLFHYQELTTRDLPEKRLFQFNILV